MKSSSAAALKLCSLAATWKVFRNLSEGRRITSHDDTPSESSNIRASTSRPRPTAAAEICPFREPCCAVLGAAAHDSRAAVLRQHALEIHHLPDLAGARLLVDILRRDQILR